MSAPVTPGAPHAGQATAGASAASGDPAGERSGEASALGLSVVLPVLNEASDLPRLLDQLRQQAAVPGAFEVLVADGGSTDGTVERVQELARQWPALRLVPNPRRRSGPGRNAGAAAARGRYVLFLDGHCSLPRSDFLRRHLEIFAESKADCLCRPQSLTGLALDSWSRAIALGRHSPLGHNPGSDIYGGEPSFTDPRSAGAAYRREVLEKLGGYDERFDACEDVEFNHRVALAGYRSYRHPDIRVEYRPRATPGGLFRQMIRYGRGRAHLMGRHPATIPLPLVALSAAAIGGAALPLLLGPPAGGLVLLCGAGLYLFLLLAEGARLAGPSAQALRIAGAIGMTHAGLLIGFWRGLFELHRFVAPRPADDSALARGRDTVHAA